VDEERRLLYVGLTRARSHLVVTWRSEGKPSRFLRELGVETVQKRPRPRPAPDEAETPAFRALRSWRLERARAEGVPAYVVFHDSTLAEIVRRSPGSAEELAGVPGVGPAKLERYAGEVLDALRSAAAS
jgi:DNA helicase II / ATP-dependent DNA helicase PcrA